MGISYIIRIVIFAGLVLVVIMISTTADGPIEHSSDNVFTSHMQSKQNQVQLKIHN